MKREDLKNISTLQELENAHRSIGRTLRRQEEAIGKDLKRVQNLFQPINLLDAGWQLAVPSAKPLTTILLNAVRRLKASVIRWK